MSDPSNAPTDPQTVPHALVVQSEPTGTDLAMAQEIAQAADIWSSWRITTHQDRFIAINAISSADESGKEVINRTLAVVGCIVGRDFRMDKQSGELVPTRKSVLILEDGGTVCTTGVYVPRFFGMMAAQYGYKRWNPPIKVILESKHLGPDRDAIKPKLAEPYVPADEPQQKEVDDGKRRRKA